MEFFVRIQTFLESLNQRTFYRYIAAIGTSVLLLMIIILIYYYKTVHNLRDTIETINEQRELIKRTVNKYQQVQQQRAAVDATLAEDKVFKLNGYFGSVLTRLHLNDKRADISNTHRDVTNNYRENTLKAKLIGMNMKELAELLQEIAANARVYTKEVEIIPSKKMPQAIDVTLAIATLEPKSVPKE